VSADINEAFERFLGRGRAAFVEKPLPTLAGVAQLVHEVGGLAVAAHLGDRGRRTDPAVRGAGTRRDRGAPPSHSSATEARLTRIAERLGLALSGGSDWHGDTRFGDSHAPLGGLEIPLAWLERLEARRDEAAGSATR